MGFCYQFSYSSIPELFSLHVSGRGLGGLPGFRLELENFLLHDLHLCLCTPFLIPSLMTRLEWHRGQVKVTTFGMACLQYILDF